MKRVVTGIAVIVGALTLVPPSAAAQNGSAWVTPKNPSPVESAGEVVLTVSLWRAGRVAYQTVDGACTVTYSPGGTTPDATCRGEGSAPEDYTAVRGELVFTEIEGSKTIRIPIVDDGLAEGDEAFTLVAWEEVNADPCGGPSVCVDRGDSVIVRIIDDDDVSNGGAVATTATTAAGSQSSSSAPFVTVSPPPSPVEDLPVPDLAVAVPSSELRPGPGFELTSGRSPEPPPAREDGGGGSASSWLAPGLGTAAAGVGALAFVRRRKQWSPTRP